MGQKSYVNAYQNTNNTIRHIYIEDGVAKSEVVRFQPFLGVHAMKSEDTKWKDMFGKPVKPVVFDSIMEMHKWKKENKGILDILGDINPCLQFIATRYQKDIEIQKEGMSIMNFDIEVVCEKGFPHASLAKYEICCITVQDMVKNEYHVFGLVPFKVPQDDERNITYYRYNNEVDMLKAFIDFLHYSKVHVLTGWNIETFDIPYIVNRCNRVLDKDYVARISPDNIIKTHISHDDKGEASTTYEFLGVITWDYFELYKRYNFEPREGKTLDYIAGVELGEAKVAFHDDFIDHYQFYNGDPQKFIEYNIKDVELIYELEKKLGFMDLAMTIMYKCKCAPESIYGTLGPWDALMYNVLLKEKIFCPPKKHNMKVEFEGGYVFPPEPGFYRWSTVFDIVSSYPNQIMSRNLSNETIVNEGQMPDELKMIKMKWANIEKCTDMDAVAEIAPILQKYGVSFTSNGNFFRIDQEGLFPKIYKELFAYRKLIKKQMKDHVKGTVEYNRLDKKQHCIKILLNSGYGAISSEHFRYFDIRIAEAITWDGQVCIRGVTDWIKKKVPLVHNFYNDTDSVFVSLQPVVEKRFGDNPPSSKEILDFLLKFQEKMIEPVIAEFFQKMKYSMNMRECTIGMEAELIADKALFTGKKRYAMRKIWDEGDNIVDHPKMKIRGFEIVRNSTPHWVREKLRECIMCIFESESNDKLLDFIEECRDEFKTIGFDKQAFPRGVNFKSYDMNSPGLPIAVRAAFKYNQVIKDLGLQDKYQDIGDGSKIKFAYIKTPNLIRSNVIGCISKMPPEIGKHFEVDIDLQFEKAFIDPIKGITDAIKWAHERKNSLEDFFS